MQAIFSAEELQAASFIHDKVRILTLKGHMYEKKKGTNFSNSCKNLHSEKNLKRIKLWSRMADIFIAYCIGHHGDGKHSTTTCLCSKLKPT